LKKKDLRTSYGGEGKTRRDHTPEAQKGGPREKIEEPVQSIS